VSLDRSFFYGKIIENMGIKGDLMSNAINVLQNKAQGGNFDALEAYFDVLIGGELKNIREHNIYIRNLCAQAMRNSDDNILLRAKELQKKSYILGAQNGSFDDYMIACEWNREPKARFWIPRRSVLEGKHKVASKIQEFLDNPYLLRLFLCMPPGSGKSTLIKFLLSYIAGRWPESLNMYVSYSDGMIKLMYDSVSDITTNDSEYCHNSIFNNGKPLCSAEYKTISYGKQGQFPTLGLVSLGGSVTGRTRANKILVSDDLVKNAEIARSKSRLDTLYEDYINTITTRTIGDYVKEMLLGTPWSLHDPMTRIRLEGQDDDRNMIISIPVWDSNEVSNFEYEHPDNYTHGKIAEIKSRLDAADFSALYLMQPYEKEGLMFPEDELKYYAGVLPDGEPDNIICFGDVAWGGGDYFSMPVGYVYGGDIYIHGVIFDQGHKHITKPRVIGSILRHQVKSGMFEANTGGHEYADDVGRILREEHDVRCNIGSRSAPSSQAKFARIEQYSPDIKQFWFLDDVSFYNQDDVPVEKRRIFRDADYKAFMRNLTTFSFAAKYASKSRKEKMIDDAPDSLAGLAEFSLGRQKQKSIATTFRRTF